MRFMKFALGGLCALGLAVAANAAEPVKIRISWVAPLANWGSIVLEKKELAQHLGKSYTLESVHYQGTPQTITAIANNELEVASLAYSSLAIAIENAGLDDLRVIADEFQDGVPGYYSGEYYVRKDSGINKVEDLKGKVIGTNGGGSAIAVAIRAMLQSMGSRRSATTPCWKDHCRRCRPCSWRRRWISFRRCCPSPSIPSCARTARCCSSSATSSA